MINVLRTIHDNVYIHDSCIFIGRDIGVRNVTIIMIMVTCEFENTQKVLPTETKSQIRFPGLDC